MDDVAQLTTDKLLETVGEIHGLAEVTGRLPSRALLIFETLDEDGDPRIDYVATKGMSLTDVMGFGHFLREAAASDLFASDDE